MAQPLRPIFRRTAVARLSSPDRLDEYIQSLPATDWLPVLVVGALLLLGLVWSVTARVATTVTGRGVIIRPRSVVEVQTIGAGRIVALTVRAGERVTAGQVIGTVDQLELGRRLEEQRTQLAELESQDRSLSVLQATAWRRQRQQTTLTRTYVESQAIALRKTLADAEALAPLIARHLTSVRALLREGLIGAAAPELLEAERASLENARQLTDLTAQLKQLDVRIAESEGLEVDLSRQHLEAASARQGEMQRLRSAIAVDGVQLRAQSQIVSPGDGRILELFAERGSVVGMGARLALLAVDDLKAPSIQVAYLDVGAGKRVRPGMRVLVTPDGVERQRYGGITGVITAVSDLPVTADGVRAMVGSAELTQALLAGSARIQVVAALDADTSNPSGYAWSSSSGPALPITPGQTGDIRVVVEQRAPITFVLPFLRELTATW